MIHFALKLMNTYDTAMIAQGENECISLSVLSVTRVPFLAVTVFPGIFSWLITLCQPILSQRMAGNGSISSNGTTQPVDVKE